MPLPSALRPPRESVVDRFLRYVRIDTQSKEDQPQVPSTPTQWDLARLLARELDALGATDVRVSEFCMVYARIPGNLPAGRSVPTIGFLAHVDTSPAVSGKDVIPVVHANYQGGDLVLPADPAQVIRAAQHPDLAQMIGDDVITTDGTTLLGSDDKSGVAAIMTLVDLLGTNPDVPHGPIAVGFTADEEVGVGIDRFDVEAFGAAFAYTVDGDALGEISHETWGARLATITFHGRSTHPGTAKGVMVNAIHALADLVAGLPSDMLPETTEGRVGFLHPYAGTIDVETSTLKVILRDFEVNGLDEKERRLRDLAEAVAARRPGVRIEIDVREQYRNMNDVLRAHPELVEFALEATRRAGLTPTIKAIRGGTDGSKLTFRGLPCPNIFTGGHNFHSRLEFNSRRGLEKTTETLVHLVQVFAEHPRAGA
ncbi:MAG TPA: peptidase T [Vicinamibacterales bacterium]|nr:peptidase T [Vicinamibacterales bacterium]